MPNTVEYCIGNVTPDARERLRASSCRTVEKPCLQRCGRCFEGALLVVDGEERTAESHADLLADLAVDAETDDCRLDAEVEA